MKPYMGLGELYEELEYRCNITIFWLGCFAIVLF